MNGLTHYKATSSIYALEGFVYYSPAIFVYTKKATKLILEFKGMYAQIIPTDNHWNLSMHVRSMPKN